MARFLFSEFVIKMNKMGLVMLTHPFRCRVEKKNRTLSLDITKNKVVDIKIDKNKRLLEPPGRNQKPVCKTVGTCRNGDFFYTEENKIFESI